MSGKIGDPYTAQKLPHLLCSTEVSHETVRLANLSSEEHVLLTQRARILGYVGFVWQAQHFQNIFAVRPADTFSFAWQVWPFLHVAKLLSGMEKKNERCFWKVIFPGRRDVS